MPVAAFKSITRVKHEILSSRSLLQTYRLHCVPVLSADGEILSYVAQPSLAEKASHQGHNETDLDNQPYHRLYFRTPRDRLVSNEEPVPVK